MGAVTQLSNVLADLAESVREEVAARAAASNHAAEHALNAGRMLCEAKAQCKHGEWLPFLERAGLGERSAQRWMLLHRAGFESAIVADLGFARAERYASEGLAMLPDDGRFCFAWGRDDGGQASALYAWWRDESGLRYGYWQVVGDEGVELFPRRFNEPWLLGALHAGQREKYDRYGERAVDMAEGMEFIEAIRREEAEAA